MQQSNKRKYDDMVSEANERAEHLEAEMKDLENELRKAAGERRRLEAELRDARREKREVEGRHW